MKPSKALVVVGDADALVALVYGEDAMHKRSRAVAERLTALKAAVVFPVTAVLEAVTVLQRKLASPAAAAQIVKLLNSGQLVTEPVNETLLKEASRHLNLAGSKRNTLFDAVVYACAKERGAGAIFSFDSWYQKQGITLAEEL